MIADLLTKPPARAVYLQLLALLASYAAAGTVYTMDLDGRANAAHGGGDGE